MRLDRRWKWKRVDGVDTFCSPDYRSAAQLLERENWNEVDGLVGADAVNENKCHGEFFGLSHDCPWHSHVTPQFVAFPKRILTFVSPPYPLHSISVQRHSREFTERLSDVEVAERRDLEAGHFVAAGVVFRLLGSDLSFKCQVQSIADQHLGHAWCVFFDLRYPSVDALEAPLVRDVVYQDDALGTPRIASDDCAESTLATCVPDLTRFLCFGWWERKFQEIAW